MPGQIKPQSEKDQSLSRRELLKALAATAGATAAAAFLPANWAKPVIKAGVLPAHAQATMEQYDLICALYDDGVVLPPPGPLQYGQQTYLVCATLCPPVQGFVLHGDVSAGTPPNPPVHIGSLGGATNASGEVCWPFNRDFIPTEVIIFDFSIYSPAGQTATCQLQFVVEPAPR
jgi:hypothetical protein